MDFRHYGAERTPLGYGVVLGVRRDRGRVWLRPRWSSVSSRVRHRRSSRSARSSSTGSPQPLKDWAVDPVRHERQGRARPRPRSSSSCPRRDHRRHHGDPRPTGWRGRPHGGPIGVPRRSGSGADPAGTDASASCCRPIVGTAVSIAVLWWLAPRPAPTGCERPTGRRRSQPMDVDRRRFVTGAIGIGSLAVIAGGHRAAAAAAIRHRRRACRRSTLPTAASPVAARWPADRFRHRRRHAVDRVPNDDFYRIDTALVGAAGAEGLVEPAHPRHGRPRDHADVRRSVAAADDRALHHAVLRVERDRR